MPEDFASAMQRRARTTREEVFGPVDVLMPITEVVDAKTAAPGMVGPKYALGGLLLLSINPAGGKDNRVSSDSDREMYEAYRSLAAASEQRRIAAFDHVNSIMLRQMPSWRVYRQHTGPILSALSRALHEIAYLYVIPFRTRGDDGGKIPRAIVERAYQEGLAEQLKALQPGLIIAMDRHAENCATRYVTDERSAVKVVYYTRKRDAHVERATCSKSWPD